LRPRSVNLRASSKDHSGLLTLAHRFGADLSGTIATKRMTRVCDASLRDKGCERRTNVVRKTGLGPAAKCNFLDLTARIHSFKLLKINIIFRDVAQTLA